MCTEGLTTTGLKHLPVTPRARFQGCTERQQEKSHIFMQIAEDKLQFLITRILELREQGI
jgi:hypothetical protein